jgi:RNA polymerase sigma-70 factor (ECF subfamily)
VTTNSERSAESDAELARQFQAGSLAAFEELVYRYERRIYAFVIQFCRNEMDAWEVTQDAFVKASQSMHQFDARREFAPWLFTIARRKWIDRQRSAPPIDGAPVSDGVDENHPGELLMQQEDRRELWCLARRCLAKSQFEALWLRYAEDMDVAQIAQVLGKTRVHVKVLLFRARQTLGNELNPAQTEFKKVPDAKAGRRRATESLPSLERLLQ